ncbi:MAG: DUF2797 domain-containing protein [Candidatus Micrarchaeota archaeon]|nr:DUF2797 domain-containing protein [Candidatus Micrarchaeota archaeon]
MRHLIRFYSGEGKPTMFFRAPTGEFGTLVLSGAQDINFSDRLACIGYKAPDGYHECRNGAIHTRQCPTCSALDMSRAYTKGDFSGYPLVYEEAKKEEYALYLAGFGGKITKCGVTRKERFESRMREQGADFGCIIAQFAGPDKIYCAEAAVQSRFMFSNSVRISQKLRLLEFDRGEARENFAGAVELARNSSAVPDFTPNIMDFSEFYPRVKNAQETHTIIGEILGAKGELLLFKSELGRHFAVNMRKKVGTFF